MARQQVRQILVLMFGYERDFVLKDSQTALSEAAYSFPCSVSVDV